MHLNLSENIDGNGKHFSLNDIRMIVSKWVIIIVKKLVEDRKQ